MGWKAPIVRKFTMIKVVCEKIQKLEKPLRTAEKRTTNSNFIITHKLTTKRRYIEINVGLTYFVLYCFVYQVGGVNICFVIYDHD